MKSNVMKAMLAFGLFAGTSAYADPPAGGSAVYITVFNASNHEVACAWVGYMNGVATTVFWDVIPKNSSHSGGGVWYAYCEATDHSKHWGGNNQFCINYNNHDTIGSADNPSVCSSVNGTMVGFKSVVDYYLDNPNPTFEWTLVD